MYIATRLLNEIILCIKHFVGSTKLNNFYILTTRSDVEMTPY